MNQKESNFVSLVFYMHNAEELVDPFLKRIIPLLEEHFQNSEIICVNDCSDDDGVNRVKEKSRIAGTTNISVVNMSYYHGIEMSMKAGIDLAIGDFVFEFEKLFFDYDPSLIMDVYRKCLEGYDIVYAVPDVKEPFSSKLFYSLFNRFASLENTIGTECFHIVSRRAFNRINDENKAVFYRKALYADCGLGSACIKLPINEYHKQTTDLREIKYRQELAIDSLILFTDVGYQFSKCMSVMMIFVTAFVLVYSVIAYAVSNPVEGWTSTILFLSVAFFGLFGILSCIIKYLQLLLKLNFKRKHYSFKSIEKLTL